MLGISVNKLLVTWEADCAPSFFGRVLLRIRPRLIKALAAVHSPAELTKIKVIHF